MTMIKISLRATKLRNVAGAFKGTSDPYAVVTWLPEGRDSKPTILGKTEVIKNDLNPNWTTTFSVDHEVGTSVSILIKIFDEIRKGDDKEMGSGVFEADEILNAKDGTKFKELEHGGTLFITAEKIESDEEADVQVEPEGAVEPEVEVAIEPEVAAEPEVAVEPEVEVEGTSTSSPAITDFISQFGETLCKSSDNTTISPQDALTGKDYILLYFSAHWCPPCRHFTPLLIDLYNKLANEKNMEVVFCSFDNDEQEYKDYSSKMPWLSLPFNAKEKRILSSKYHAQSIPHLIVVDGKTGKVISEDGADGLRNDEEGSNFPWKPKSFSEIWPDKILSSKGSQEKFLNSDTLKEKYLMLYFSGHWCPPCRHFTPKLSEAYTKLKKERDDFELVFISSDRDESSFNEYFETMTFCALPFEHREEDAALSEMFKVEGIPTLVMLGPVADESGNRPLINADISNFIKNEEFAEFPFHRKNYGSLDDADDLVEVKAVLIFHENGDDEEQEHVKRIAKEAALKAKVNGKDVNIYWALSSVRMASTIRASTKLPAMSNDPAMVIFDIPDDGGYYKSDVTDITVENILAFIDNPGDRFQLED